MRPRPGPAAPGAPSQRPAFRYGARSGRRSRRNACRPQTPFGGDFTERADGGALGRRALVMRMPPTTSTPRSSARAGSRLRPRPVEAILQERDELQVKIGRDAALHLEKASTARSRSSHDVHMAADGQQPTRHGEVAVTQRPIDHRLQGEKPSAHPKARFPRGGCRIR